MLEFKIDWPALIEKSKKLCEKEQKQLADEVSVSQEIISKFESGDENIQLSDVLKILDALERMFKNSLDFQDEYTKNGTDIEFIAHNKNREPVHFQITQNALTDFFPKEKNLLEVFKKNKEEIHKIARLKYLYSPEKSPPILIIIDSSDFQGDS